MSGGEECPIVECMRKECRDKCGTISWFGNLSNCDVTLQYQIGEGGIWHSLGEFAPGMHTELGGGALFLPSESIVRVIETPLHTNNDDDGGGEGKVRVIQNWGKVGTGLPSLYIDNSMCNMQNEERKKRKEAQCSSTSSSSPQKQSNGNGNVGGPPKWLLISCVILALLSVMLSLLVAVVTRKK
jgi:hypothetical protein